MWRSGSRVYCLGIVVAMVIVVVMITFTVVASNSGWRRVSPIVMVVVVVIVMMTRWMICHVMRIVTMATILLMPASPSTTPSVAPPTSRTTVV